MPASRDDFTIKTKETLAKRAAYRCSNPACRRLTVGPGSEESAYINVGVAAHICAAAENGPRYDAEMSSEERKSIRNGIWLCQTCAKLIDSDVDQYTVKTLHSWKRSAELGAAVELLKKPFSNDPQDIELIQFYISCFDRPAFKTNIYQEDALEDFEKALEDTLIALNTGVLRDRSNYTLRKEKGKSSIRNRKWRKQLDRVAFMLMDMLHILSSARLRGEHISHKPRGKVWYEFESPDSLKQFNHTRAEILKILRSIARDAGLGEDVFQHKY